MTGKNSFSQIAVFPSKCNGITEKVANIEQSFKQNS